MPTWINDKRDFKFRMPGEFQDTKFQISGVMDETGNEHAQIIIANHPENKGSSIENPSARGECIRSISDKLNIEPQIIDWYMQDANGEIKSLTIESRLEKITNPQYEEYLRKGEFGTPGEAEKAKKYFPDIEVERLDATAQDIKPEQQEKLDTAFNEARINRELYEAIERERSSNQIDKSGHEYDLSHESFSH